MEERTLQAERLAAIGQMISVLTHESGNALARSQILLATLADEVRDRPEAVALIGHLQSVADRPAQVVRGGAELRLADQTGPHAVGPRRHLACDVGERAGRPRPPAGGLPRRTDGRRELGV